MKNLIKELFATSISVAILFAIALSWTCYCVNANELTIELNVKTNITVESQKTTLLKFIPAKSGNYSFTSFSDEDTYGYLFDSNKRELANDDEGGDYHDFCVKCRLIAGETYYFGARYFDQDKSGKFDVLLTFEAQTECEHKNSSWIIVKESTCIQEGSKNLICNNCNKVLKTEIIPISDNHLSVKLERIEPTCTQKGKTEGSQCSLCKKVLIEQEEIAALGHDMTKFKIKKYPDCINEGLKYRYCNREGCTEYENVIIEALGHKDSKRIIDVDSSCTSPGEWHTECTVCGVKTDGGKIEAKGHKYVTKTQNPTCTEPGYKKNCCSRCHYYEDIETIPPTGHSYVVKTTVAPTCTKIGAKTYVCLNCSETHEADIPKLGHNYSKNWTIDKAATCTTDGKKSHHCTRCTSKSQVTVIAKKGHKIVEDKAVKPTCEKSGKTAGSHCSVCGKKIKAQSTIKALGHKYKTTLTKATINKNGKSVTKCTVCGKTSKSTVIKKVSYIKLSNSSYIYDAKEKYPSVTVKDSNGKSLTLGKDYSVSYAKGRKNPGIYKVKITLTGNYSGTKTLSFSIKPKKVDKLSATQSTNTVKLTWNKVTGAKGYRVYKYNTKSKKYVKITDTTKTTYTFKNLSAATAYRFKVKPYVKTGNSTVWGESTTILTATKPKAPVFKALGGIKKVTLGWNKISGASGYEIYMATSKYGTYKKAIVVEKQSVLMCVKSGLANDKTYYFKMRAYKLVNGKKIYSSYSNIKKVQTKPIKK